MDKPRVLVADSDPEFQLALTQALRDHCEVSCCGSGRVALSLLRKFCPKVLVLNLMLPELDGFGILQSADWDGEPPIILAMVPILNPYIVETATALNVTYMMRQPCDVLAAAKRILDLLDWPRRHIEDAQTFLSGPMHSLGFNTRLLGYHHLIQATVLISEKPGQSVTKELYPAVGKRSSPKASGEQVEKLIRYAIRTAWKQGDREAWHRYFPQDQRPSNSEFISRMAELLGERRRCCIDAGRWMSPER